MGCKKQGAKNKVIVIQKVAPHIFSGSQTDPCFQNKNSGCRLTGQVRKWLIHVDSKAYHLFLKFRTFEFLVG